MPYKDPETQRSYKRAAFRKGTLDASRRERLEATSGWTWDPYAQDWEEVFAALQGFVEREGHARVPPDHREDGYALGGWVKRQRGSFNRGQLGARRRARLEALPGWAWRQR